MKTRTPTTRDVGLMWQLHQDGQLVLRPEFQRFSVWPRPARAFLIDTILENKPIPLLFLQRSRSSQTGRTTYQVIDGQQRLRAIFEFLENKFPLSSPTKKSLDGLRFSELPKADQDQILNYDLFVDEVTGYSDKDIRDIFERMNKYVVKLSSQELRHARHAGGFSAFANELGKLPFWRKNRVFSDVQFERMRNVEFAAEIAILVLEGPQDKKGSVDLYYGTFPHSFPDGRRVKHSVTAYLAWIERSVPTLSTSFVRKPTDLYSLLGALIEVCREPRNLAQINRPAFVRSLEKLRKDLLSRTPSVAAVKYKVASSRQTDNIAPRKIRIEIMKQVVLGKL